MRGIVGTIRRLLQHPGIDSYFNQMTHFDLKRLLPAFLQVRTGPA